MSKLHLVTVLLLVFMYGCKKSDDSDNSPGNNKPATTIKTNKSTITLANKIDVKDSFSIEYIGKWTISTEPATANWLTLSATAGNGNALIFVSVNDRNTTSANRTAKVIITPSTAIDKPVTITVTQEVLQNFSLLTAYPGFGRITGTGFVTTEGIFFGFGIGTKDNKEQELTDFYQYNLNDKIWKRKNDILYPREYANAFTSNNRGYIFMGVTNVCDNGCTQTYHKDLLAYDADADNFSSVHDFNELDINLINSSQIVMVDEVPYLIQNFDSQQKMWAINMSDFSLIEKKAFPDFIMGVSYFVLNGKIYGISGVSNDPSLIFKSVYVYDPYTNEWSRKKDFPGLTRSRATAFASGGKGYICQGGYWKEISPGNFMSTQLNDMWQYDDVNDSWSQLEDVPWEGRSQYVGMANGQAIIVTFERPDALTDINNIYAY